jgi:hypothetical protein
MMATTNLSQSRATQRLLKHRLRVARFRAKKFFVRASSSMNITLAFAVSIMFVVWRERKLVYTYSAAHGARMAHTHIWRTVFVSRCHDERFG